MVTITYCTSYTAICTPACQNNGTCSSPGVCNCTAEWSGERCGDRSLSSCPSNACSSLHNFSAGWVCIIILLSLLYGSFAGENYEVDHTYLNIPVQ